MAKKGRTQKLGVCLGNVFDTKLTEWFTCLSASKPVVGFLLNERLPFAVLDISPKTGFVEYLKSVSGRKLRWLLFEESDKGWAFLSHVSAK